MQQKLQCNKICNFLQALVCVYVANKVVYARTVHVSSSRPSAFCRSFSSISVSCSSQQHTQIERSGNSNTCAFYVMKAGQRTRTHKVEIVSSHKSPCTGVEGCGLHVFLHHLRDYPIEVLPNLSSSRKETALEGRDLHRKSNEIMPSN